jgi:putative transposase
MSDLFPDDVAPEDWEEACRRADAISEHLRRRPNRSTTEKILELATVLGVSQATAYRLVRLFREGGTVSALVERKRGRRKDHHTLDKEREETPPLGRSQVSWLLHQSPETAYPAHRR